MIEGILPPTVSVGECFGELAGEVLFPIEEESIARAVDKRRREFRTVRGCARIALAGLGLQRLPMVPGERGAPPWPPGIIGSMTHCAGYRAAVAARQGALRGIGVDAEPHEALPGRVAPLVCSAAELRHLSRLAELHPGVHWDRLLFSAKESVYKAWYPLTGLWLGFEDADVRFDAARHTFDVQIRPATGRPVLTGLSGRWLVRQGLVLTAVTAAQVDLDHRCTDHAQQP